MNTLYSWVARVMVSNAVESRPRLSGLFLCTSFSLINLNVVHVLQSMDLCLCCSFLVFLLFFVVWAFLVIFIFLVLVLIFQSHPEKKASKAVWEGREDSDLAEYVSPYFLFSLIFKKNIFCISRQLFSSYFFLQRNVVEGRKEKVSLSGKLMCSGLRFALKSSKYSRLILF